MKLYYKKSTLETLLSTLRMISLLSFVILKKIRCYLLIIFLHYESKIKKRKKFVFTQNYIEHGRKKT